VYASAEKKLQRYTSCCINHITAHALAVFTFIHLLSPLNISLQTSFAANFLALSLIVLSWSHLALLLQARHDAS
jgi:hypothetical protein